MCRIGVILLLLVLPRQSLASIAVIDPGVDDRLASITGLEILGTTYDLMFHHGVNFSSLGAGAITFTTPGDADTAIGAVAALINGATIGYDTTPTNVFVVPYDSTVSSVDSGISQNSGGGPSSTYDFGAASPGATVDPDALINTNDAWVTFTAIPEPSSFLFFAVVTCGCMGCRWKTVA